MCLYYKVAFVSCRPHIGRSYFFPCASPQTCQPQTERLIKLEQYSDIAGGCLELPDFCPTCLENGGSFGDSLGDEARDKMADHPLYRNFHDYNRIVKQMWERVESHPTKVLVAHANVVEDATAASSLTLHIALNLYHLLAFSFWREVITGKRSPSLVKRRLLVQIRMYLMSQGLKEMARIHFLREAHKSIRPTLLMTVLRSVDLDDLADEDSDCTICTLPLGNPDGIVKPEIPVKTPCGHIFGNQCICTWIRDNATCPNCRRELLSLTASQSVLAGQQEISRSQVPMPMFLYRILGLDPDNADGDLAIIKEQNFKAYILQKQDKELKEKTEANIAGLVALDLSGNSIHAPEPESE
ncbi:hypothetical protein DL98DRAFT_532318 [Cadophora sp. DSE1049]|nr:hypothetical protein DL98DRAFT_532318 [Cadophora sp. DSE1049]